MKLLIALLTTSLLQAHAGSFAQTITMNVRNASLAKIFAEVKKQTGYVVISSYALLEKATPVTINVQSEPVESFIRKVLKDQPLEYTIENKTISIREKRIQHTTNENTTNAVKTPEEPFPVKGTVTDDNGNPLRGATVSVKSGSRSVETDAGGQFNLLVTEGEIIVISFVGYDNREIRINAKNLTNGVLSVTLRQSIAELDEMVFKGYYSESKRLSTSSISKVTSKEISRQPVGNVMSALEGRMAGIAITQNSGLPGASFVIQIRGQNSLRNSQGANYGNYPLYIVDGVPYPAASLNITGVSAYGSSDIPNRGVSPLNYINPNDIESVEVLKDADATSIYGSRGANGVVLIVTKKGKAGKMKADANVYMGSGTVERRMKVLNTQQYLNMRKEALRNDNTPIRSTDYDINGAWDTTRYTDWQDVLFGGSANVTNADLSLSGGNFNTQYRISTGYRKESTVFPGDYADQRATVGLNLSSMSTNQRFKVNLVVNYGYNKNAMLFNDLTINGLLLAPDAPALYDSAGNLNWQKNTFDNPLKNSQRPYDGKTNSLNTSATISYEILKGLTISSNLGYNNTTLRETGKTFKTYFNPQQAANQQLAAVYGNTFANTWQVEPQLNYRRAIGKGQLNALAGGAFQQSLRDQTRISANGFADPVLMDNIAFATQNNITTIYNYSKYRFNSFFGRLRYDWNNRYIVNLTARRDGSSRFGPDRKFADFGSAAVAWIFSNEEFVRNGLPFLSFGKLRGSYGSAGNDQIPDYGFLDNYAAAGNYMGAPASTAVRLFNADYGWEVNRKLETAIDLGFLNDHILLTAAYYYNRSSNQLIGQVLPPTAGFTSIQSNLPALVQNTGFELEITSTNIRKKDFSWTSSFNISVPRNKLVAFPNLENTPIYSSLYVVGKSVFISKVYHYLGIDQSTGLPLLEDVNKDGFLNTMDQRAVFTGKKYHGGLSNSITYKNFTFDLFFQFVKQTDFKYINNTPGTAGTNTQGNQPTDVLDHWQKAGDMTAFPRYGVSSAAQNAFINFSRSDGFLGDASFIRWKNLAISYTLPQGWIKKLNLQSTRLYFQAQNLLTITSYTGLDPETGLSLPPLRMLTTGLQLTL